MGSQNADLLDTLLESTDVEAFGESRVWPAILLESEGSCPLTLCVHLRLSKTQQSCAPALVQDLA